MSVWSRQAVTPWQLLGGEEEKYGLYCWHSGHIGQTRTTRWEGGFRKRVRKPRVLGEACLEKRWKEGKEKVNPPFLNNWEKQADLPLYMAAVFWANVWGWGPKFWGGKVQYLIKEPMILPVSFAWPKVSSCPWAGPQPKWPNQSDWNVRSPPRPELFCLTLEESWLLFCVWI